MTDIFGNDLRIRMGCVENPIKAVVRKEPRHLVRIHPTGVHSDPLDAVQQDFAVFGRHTDGQIGGFMQNLRKLTSFGRSRK